jgi:superfamily II DNA or RNA helicase
MQHLSPIGSFDVDFTADFKNIVFKERISCHNGSPLIVVEDLSNAASFADILRPNDILLSVNGKPVPAVSNIDILSFISENCIEGSQIKLLRPVFAAQFRGVANVSVEFKEPPPEFAENKFLTKVQLPARGKVFLFGPFSTENAAAAFYDHVILTVCGTRLSFMSNFHLHLSKRVSACESIAKLADFAGNVNGGRTALLGASYGQYTYAGSGFISTSTFQGTFFNGSKIDVCIERDETASEKGALLKEINSHFNLEYSSYSSLHQMGSTSVFHPRSFNSDFVENIHGGAISSQPSASALQISKLANVPLPSSLNFETELATKSLEVSPFVFDSPGFDAYCVLNMSNAPGLVFPPRLLRPDGSAYNHVLVPEPFARLSAIGDGLYSPSCGTYSHLSLSKVGLFDQVSCNQSQRGGDFSHRPLSSRVKEIRTTLTAVVSDNGSKDQHVATSTVHPRALSKLSKSDLRNYDGGIADKHPLFEGVYLSKGKNVFFALEPSIDVNVPLSARRVINVYRQATFAACAYDRAVRRFVVLSESKHLFTNFDDEYPFSALSLSSSNISCARPELFGFVKSIISSSLSETVNSVFKAEQILLYGSALPHQVVDVNTLLKSMHSQSLDFIAFIPHAKARYNALLHKFAQEDEGLARLMDDDSMTCHLGTSKLQMSSPLIAAKITFTPLQHSIVQNQINLLVSMKNGHPLDDTIVESATLRITDPLAIPKPAAVPQKQTKRQSSGKKRKSSWDDDDEEDEPDWDDDEDDDEEEEVFESEDDMIEGDVIPKSYSYRKSSRQGAEKVYRDEPDIGDVGEDADVPSEEDDEFRGEEDKPRKKVGRGRKRKLTVSTQPQEPQSVLPIPGPPTVYKVDKILGVRYAEVVEEGSLPWGDGSEWDDESAKRYYNQQYNLLINRPVEVRRNWENLEYLARYKGLSYLHVEWVSSSLLREEGPWGKIKANRFLESPEAHKMLEEEEERLAEGRDPPLIESLFDEDFIIPERILAAEEVLVDDEETETKKPVMYYLVKWKGLPYSDCAWETAADIGDDQLIESFLHFNTPPSDIIAATPRYDPQGRDYRPVEESLYKEPPTFKGRTVRDYQVEGMNWMIHNWHYYRNCILADEMGLGKTVQTVTFLEHLRTRVGVRGPFLIVAPLSTLGHWKREFEQWTDMNAIYYHDPVAGGGTREIIRKYEWEYPENVNGKVLASSNIFKFNVIITSFHVLLMDWEHFMKIRWRAVVVDEAHALKNRESQLQLALQTMRYDFLLLLTGTPLQNDVKELWALLNLINKDVFSSLPDFVREYGDLKNSEQVTKLQKQLGPYMLRRAKEDVEKSIPPKEETIINVELTSRQKQYYRAIFDRNRSFLSKGVGTAPAANLVNIEMELRKCCNHPFLLRHVDIRETANVVTRLERLEVMIALSGKMVLLDKLLPKLKAEGHRVLIFSQFKSMLTLIEELLLGRGYKYERIDGSIRGNERQAAIDRYNKSGSDIFAFILSTKAGGQGINLTTADTIIIFDSDWNPQNDVQAMARAHRIGQTKDVRIYRLVTSKTYEAEMFKRASRKLGLSQAVFEGPRLTDDVHQEDGGVSALLTLDKDKIEALLKYGAYAIMDDEAANAASAQFEQSSIDAILSKSSTIRYENGNVVDQEGGTTRKGLNLSKATFAVDENDQSLDVRDPSFWEKVLGPKPAVILYQALRGSPSVLDDIEKLPQWVADLTAVLDDVFEDRCDGRPNDSSDTVSQIVFELLTQAKKVPHPLSAVGITSRISRSNPVPFPGVSPALIGMIGGIALANAAAREKAAAGRGNPPASDGDCSQNDGSLADFAKYWLDKLDKGRRGRKRGGAVAPVASGRKRHSKNTVNVDDEADEESFVPRKRGRDDDGEVEATEDLASVSNIRIRLTPSVNGSPFVANQPLISDDESAGSNAENVSQTQLPFFSIPNADLEVSGYSKSQVFAASQKNISVQAFVEEMRGENSFSSKSAVVNEFFTNCTKKIMSWLSLNRPKHATLALALPQVVKTPNEVNDSTGFTNVPCLKLVAAYDSISGKTIKPSNARGPRAAAPEWCVKGLPVDPEEVNRRLKKRTLEVRKKEKRQMSKQLATEDDVDESETADEVMDVGAGDRSESHPKTVLKLTFNVPSKVKNEEE